MTLIVGRKISDLIGQRHDAWNLSLVWNTTRTEAMVKIRISNDRRVRSLSIKETKILFTEILRRLIEIYRIENK